MEEKNKNFAIMMVIFKGLFLIVLIAVIISAGKKAYSFGYRVFAEDTVSDPPGKKVAITIEEGISSEELTTLLKKKGLIKDENIFRVQYMLSQYKGKLKGGSYVLNTSQKSDEMLAEMAGANETETETE